MKKLDELERRVTALHSDSRITASFADGSQRKLKSSEVIPLLKTDAAPRVVSIDGGEGDDGCLLELLRGLTE